MAIHVNRITVAAPVLNAITLGAGGSLVVGTPTTSGPLLCGATGAGMP